VAWPRGLQYKELARLIDRNPSMASREVARHGGRERYRAVSADKSAVAGSGRSRMWSTARHGYTWWLRSC
jgi:IS30 family transposase